MILHNDKRQFIKRHKNPKHIYTRNNKNLKYMKQNSQN